MTVIAPQARHPLTDEKLNIRDVINEVVDTAQLAVLRSFSALSNPTTLTDLAEVTNISRQVVSSHLAILHNRGLVNRYEGGVELTAGGLTHCDAIEDCLQTVSVDALAFLTRSTHPLVLIEKLVERPSRLGEIQSTANELPSRSTIRRILKQFIEYGWLETSRRQYRITSIGETVFTAYQKLATTTEQLIKKSPWLQRLPIEAATFPVEELDDADIVVSNPRNPASVLATCLKLYDRRVNQFRCLCSVYNPVLFHAYRGLLELDIEAEAILDRPTAVKAAKNRGTRYAIQTGGQSNYRPLMLDEPQTIGIGLYDDRKVAVAAYNEQGSGRHIAMIISSNDQLVEWSNDLYESYRAKAVCPSTLLSH